MKIKSDYARARISCNLREPSPPRLSEIEIQARLFAGEYGTRWKTTDGRQIEILHFGEWNHEAGPDFKGAKFRFSDDVERTGDLEVDMDARDWERHGHATNPAFAGVLLQLFLHHGTATAFARTSDHNAIPQAQLCIEGSASRVLRHSPGIVNKAPALLMIEEAADFRLRTKHDAYARAISLHGADTALFHALARGLGYKNNTIPFLLVAQRIGLRNASAADGESRLFGISGFLEPRTFDKANGVTRSYLKPLWNNWWALRDDMSRLILPMEAWKFSGIRPSNHPHRRMGALASIARDFGRLRRAIRTSGGKGFKNFFKSLSHPYWTTHWNLSTDRLDGQMALVGEDRVLDLLINAFLPSLPIEKGREELASLPGPTPSTRVRRACEWLVGSLDKELLRTARHQQGLLQLLNDFGSLTALEAWKKIQSG